MQVPRSVFLGRVVAPGEPAWLPEDRAWLMALQKVHADECRGCGQPLSETLHPDNSYAYDATVHGVCAGCYAKDLRIADRPAGTYATVHRRHDHPTDE